MADQRHPAKCRDKEIIFFLQPLLPGIPSGKKPKRYPGKGTGTLLRHPYLKRAPYRSPGLLDGHPGDRKDLPYKEEAETGIFPVTPVKDDLLLFLGYTGTVVLDKEDQPVGFFLVP